MLPKNKTSACTVVLKDVLWVDAKFPCSRNRKHPAPVNVVARAAAAQKSTINPPLSIPPTAATASRYHAHESEATYRVIHVRARTITGTKVHTVLHTPREVVRNDNRCGRHCICDGGACDRDNGVVSGIHAHDSQNFSR